MKRLTPTIENKASDAIMQLMNVNIPELYKKLTREDKQAFWQSIIKEIHIIDQNNENYEIFLINLCTKQVMPLGITSNKITKITEIQKSSQSM